MPDSAVRQPGPLRYVTRDADARGDLPGSVRSAALTSGTRTWEVIYWDNYMNVYAPLVGAGVIGEEGEPATPVNAVTGYQGRFETGCEMTAFYPIWMEVRAENAAVIVVLPNTIVATVGGGAGGCDDQQIIASSEESHVFTNVRITASNSLTFFNRSRSQVTVKIDPFVPTSLYDPVNDQVWIKSVHVFGLSAPEAAAHEFGHAWHHHALDSLPPEPICTTGEHGLSAYTNLRCAYWEGFAEYYSVVTRPDATTGLTSQLENVPFILDNSPPAGDPNDPDGTLMEGLVAAFLFDLTDPANEAHDAGSLEVNTSRM